MNATANRPTDFAEEPDHYERAKQCLRTVIKLEMSAFLTDELLGSRELAILADADRRFGFHFSKLSEVRQKQLARKVDAESAAYYGDDWEVFKFYNMDDVFDCPDMEAIKRAFCERLTELVDVWERGDVPRTCLNQAANALADCRDELPPDEATRLGLEAGSTFADAVAMYHRLVRERDDFWEQSRKGSSSASEDPEIEGDLRQQIQNLMESEDDGQAVQDDDDSDTWTKEGF